MLDSEQQQAWLWCPSVRETHWGQCYRETIQHGRQCPGARQAWQLCTQACRGMRDDGKTEAAHMLLLELPGRVNPDQRQLLLGDAKACNFQQTQPA